MRTLAAAAKFWNLLDDIAELRPLPMTRASVLALNAATRIGTALAAAADYFLFSIFGCSSNCVELHDGEIRAS